MCVLKVGHACCHLQSSCDSWHACLCDDNGYIFLLTGFFLYLEDLTIELEEEEEEEFAEFHRQQEECQ